LLASLLFGVGAGDPFTLAAVAMFLLAVALAACYFPPAAPCALIPWARCAMNDVP